MEGDRRRYLDIYGVDLLDMANYDLVIDATILAPQEVAYQIMKAARARQMID
jgi:cytidylate kinase